MSFKGFNDFQTAAKEFFLSKNYHLKECIHKGSSSLVFRAKKENSEKKFIIKISCNGDIKQRQRFKRDLDARNKINSNLIVKACEFGFFNSSPFILMEDFGGIPLNIFLEGKSTDIEIFLNLAIKIILAIDTTHKNKIIHKDIKPSNILINPDTMELKLNDFGISTMLDFEHPGLMHPDSMEGTLSYISPEQTGRINRFLDYRTDFYSAGVTLYQMATGKLPFLESSPMEIIHSHIAKRPIPISSYINNFPEPVSAIIHRMLEKNPDKRYQSASGILYDLETAQKFLMGKKFIPSFELGMGELIKKFKVSEKVYGRENELSKLSDSYDNLLTGKKQFIAVSGYSGSGKTVLVDEFKKKMLSKNCFFISGKFDQINKGNVYNGIIQAFKKLTDIMLGNPHDEISLWKKEIVEAIGENGKIITDLIPGMEKIIGKQKEIHYSNSTNERNRFNHTFGAFVQSLSKKERPLILFLDDLQWMDSASEGLLRYLIIHQPIKYFMIIGSFRSNEVAGDHALLKLFDDADAAEIEIKMIDLSPLDNNAVLNLVKDTLGTDKDKTKNLSDVIIKKTGANPFFIKEFLKNLHYEKIIFFNDSKNCWDWNIDKAAGKRVTENLLELVTERIKKLPLETVSILQYAACMGISFNKDHLKKILNLKEDTFFELIAPAVRESIIAPAKVKLHVKSSSDTGKNIFEFQHDKIQQAVYTTIERKMLQSIHLDIGMGLIPYFNMEKSDELLFDIVNHLNHCHDLIKDKNQLEQLILFNMESGLKAEKNSAYKRARLYFKMAHSLLEKTPDNPELKYEIIKKLADINYLIGEFNQSKEFLTELLQQESSPLKKADLYQLLILIHTMNADYNEALLTGQKALKLLGVELPLKNIEETADKEVSKAVNSISDKNIEELIHLKDMSDQYIKKAMKLLMRLQATAYFFKNELYPFILAKMTNFSLEYGHTPESAKGYGSFANIFASKTKDLKTAYKIGILGLDLSKKYNDKQVFCQTSLSISAFLIHGVDHLAKGQTFIENGFKAGLESGEIQYAGLILFNKTINNFFLGRPLNLLKKEIPHDIRFSTATGNHIGTDVMTPFYLFANYMGGDKNSFSADGISESQYLNRFYKNKSYYAIFLFRLLKAFAFYLEKKNEDALKELKLAYPMMNFSLGYFSETEFYFLETLILIGILNDQIEEKKSYLLKKIEKNIQWLEVKSKTAPQNHIHRLMLIKAEFESKIRNDFKTALDFYELSIEAAEKYNYIQIQAIANELAGDFLIRSKKPKLARPFIEDAKNSYYSWGAYFKANELSSITDQYNRTSQIRFPNKFTDETTHSSSRDSSKNYSLTLDLESVTQASQAISSEVKFDKLMKKLIRIIIKNAGAENGFIILKKGNNLYIEASSKLSNEKIYIETRPLDSEPDIIPSIARYVMNTGENIIINNSDGNERFFKERKAIGKTDESILCTPLKYKDQPIGVLYLSNSLSLDIFSKERLFILNTLLPQASISIENALLIEKLQNTTRNLEKEIEYRKKIEDDLKQSERKYRGIFENTQDIYIETTMDGKILEVSPSIKESSFYSRDELIGSIIDEDYMEKSERIRFIKELLKKEKLSNFEAVCRNKDGEKVHCSINATISDQNKEKIILSIRDVSEKKSLEEKLLQAQKMEAIGTLTGGIAHDFNNILAGITGYTDMALFNLHNQPEKIESYLKGIEKASERAKSLISQILSFSRKSEGTMKKINPLPAIKEAMNLLRSSTPSSIKIIKDIEIDQITIKGDPTQLNQVIMNVATNALHSMKSKGGVLKVSVKKNIITEESNANSITGIIPPGTYLEVSVADNGHGIPEDIKQKIFDPYFTTKKTGEGTGLGLAMVLGIIKKHSGYVSFESVEKEGSNFTFLFPAFDEVEEEKENDRSKMNYDGSGTILIVDDETTIIEIMKELLSSVGYSVIATENPVEAIEIFKQEPDKFNLVITDMTMPQMTGNELAKLILSINPDIPIIVTTGYSEELLEQDLEKLNIKKRLTKPFNMETLLKSIKELIG